MNIGTYSSLHNHTEYSNLKLIDSINRSESLIKYAYELGLKGVAITDHDSLSAHLKAIEFYENFIEQKYKEICAAQGIEPNDNLSFEEKIKVVDFKLVLGNEIYLTRDGLDEATAVPGEPFYHFILLAKDKEGHKQLRQLSSRAWERAWFRAILRTPTYLSDLVDIVKGGHLVATTACIGGFTGKMFMNMRDDDPSQESYYLERITNFLNWTRELFGMNNFFIELQPSFNEDQIEYNKFMIEHFWGNFNFSFATDSHYLKKEDRGVHKAFLNSKASKDREVDEFYSAAYMMSAEEVYSYMKDYIDIDKFNIMAANTNKIKDMCQYYTLKQDQVVTKVEYEPIDDETSIFDDVDFETHPYLHYYLTTSDEADHYFIQLLAKGFCEKYEPEWDFDKYIDRLEEELWTIHEISKTIGKSLSDYFISMHKMIDIIWNEADSFVGPSRGSAGAALSNYLLGITQMDPLKQELVLPVWRFLHPSRPDLPDIDIDTESSKRVRVFKRVQDYFKKLGGNLVNICTFGTEGTKSALKTAARGLNIDDDVITYLTSMIPNERGFDWTLDQCYYGDDEHTAIKAFKEEIDNYPQLWELARTIEGLVTRLGVHASGVVAVNCPFTEYNSYMKTSKGQIVSAFDLHDSEKMGLIKYDFLTVSALDRIRQTFNYLLEDKIITWQGDLRSTYNKYLSPDKLDYTSPEMWDMVAQGKITSLFQFDTITGSQAIKKIQPTSLTQLAIANSVMRLMGDGELPLDVYTRYKNNINLWYDELHRYNLTSAEIAILEKHLLKLSGVADSQESVMMLVMDPQISGFDMKEANKLRKTIAKKQFREIEAVKQLFFDKGTALGTSQNLLSYIWFVQISRQLGYSFSSIHTTGYSIMAVQEMNLAYKYPIIYWNTACLSVDASATTEEDFYNLLDEGILDVADEDDVRDSNKMDYGKVASAIDKFRDQIDIELPDINESRLGFTPDVKNNSILYGLKGITRITAPVIQEIMLNRPFKSLDDFCKKVTKRIVTKDKIVNLIKSGAFNKLEGKTTTEVLKQFISTTADQKQRLTMQNANMLIDCDLIPDEFKQQKELYKLTKELRKNRDPNKWYYIPSHVQVSEEQKPIWLSMILQHGELRDMVIAGEEVKVIDSNRWDAIYYEPEMNKIRNYIKQNQQELLEKLNHKLFMDEWNKYAEGDELSWELDSINFYKSGHPLDKAIYELPVEVTPLKEIEENAQDGSFFIKGKTIPKMRIYAIAGTVIDKDKPKGLVTLQTPDGIAEIKIYKDLFAIYNHTISEVDDDGGKTVLEDSFFEKGTHLLVHGILRGATFLPKVYKSTGYKSILKIQLTPDGHFDRLIEKAE